jgi:sarcosine oxidase subunit beta
VASGTHSADVIVIGGGLHGCATALHLARAGLAAIVVEKDSVGRHASSANAGGVRRLGRALPEIPLAVAALACWHRIRELVDDDCGFASSCQVKVAETESELQALRRRRDTVLNLGFKHEEIIDQAQLRELVPAIAPHCVGAMVVHGDGHADPFLTVQAFKRKALALGVRILEDAPVEALQRLGETWQVHSARGDLEAPILVNCAGAWGGHIAAMLGEHAPVEARALMLMITARVKAFVKPVVGAQGRMLSFKQFHNGTVLIGGGHQGRAEPERNRTHLNFNGLAASAASAAKLFPCLRAVQVVRCWAGIEGEMPDGIPVIGAGAAKGVYHAFGFSGHGFALGPIVGRIIADLVVTGNTDLPIGAFGINRFSKPGGRARMEFDS